jgi:hypothetical protein
MNTPKKSDAHSDVGYVAYNVGGQTQGTLSQSQPSQPRNSYLETPSSNRNQGVLIEELNSTPADFLPQVSRVLDNPNVKNLLSTLIPIADPSTAAQLSILLNYSKSPVVSVPDTPLPAEHAVFRTPPPDKSQFNSRPSTPIFPPPPASASFAKNSLGVRSSSLSSLGTPSRSSTGTTFSTDTKSVKRPMSDTSIRYVTNKEKVEDIIVGTCSSLAVKNILLSAQLSLSSPNEDGILQERNVVTPSSETTAHLTMQSGTGTKQSKSKIVPGTKSIPISISSNSSSSLTGFEPIESSFASPIIDMESNSSEAANRQDFFDEGFVADEDFEDRNRYLEGEAANEGKPKTQKKTTGKQKKLLRFFLLLITS